MYTMKRAAILARLLLCACLLMPGISTAQQTLLVMGDSLSAAFGIPREAGWVNLLQAELQGTHPTYQIINASVSGETTSGAMRRLPALLRQHRPAVVILELGANDGLRGTPTQEIESNLRELIRQSQKAGAKVLLLGMQLPPNYGGHYTVRFKTLYARLAKKQQAALVPFFLEGVTSEQFQADQLHPDASAQETLLRNVLPALLPLL